MLRTSWIHPRGHPLLQFQHLLKSHEVTGAAVLAFDHITAGYWSHLRPVLGPNQRDNEYQEQRFTDLKCSQPQQYFIAAGMDEVSCFRGMGGTCS
jgi:hypothetical protein